MNIKFKNIKIGDTVITEECVKYGWGLGSTFYIPSKVVKVTKTQFVTENKARFNKDGREIGEYRHAYDLGDKPNTFSDTIVSDQTKERDLFITKIKLERDISKSIGLLKIELDSNLNIIHLNRIKYKLDEINKTLGKA
jgi:hypothetical protein